MSPRKKQGGRTATSTQARQGSVRGTKAVAKHLATPRRGLPELQSTFVEDRGAVYDAPLEVVWDFMEKDEKFHPKAHASKVRNFVSQDLSDVTKLLSFERRTGGQWEKRVCRMTTIRPVVRVQEDLDGTYAGSTTVFLYRPQGKQTVVDVFGYARSSGLTPAEIKRDRLQTWSRAFSEDLPYFRRFAEQHPAVRAKRS